MAGVDLGGKTILSFVCVVQCQVCATPVSFNSCIKLCPVPCLCHLLVPMFCLVRGFVVRLVVLVNKSVPVSHGNLFVPSLQSTALRVCPSVCLCVRVFFCVSVNACVTVKLCSMSVCIFLYCCVDHCVEGRERFGLGKSVWFAAYFAGMAVTAIAIMLT